MLSVNHVIIVINLILLLFVVIYYIILHDNLYTIGRAYVM